MIANERDAALIAVGELESALKGTGLPVVCLIGLPTSGQMMRFSAGMSNKHTRAFFMLHFADLLHAEQARHEAKAKKGGR